MVETLQSILIYTVLWGSIYLLSPWDFRLICAFSGFSHMGYGATFVLALCRLGLHEEAGLG